MLIELAAQAKLMPTNYVLKLYAPVNNNSDENNNINHNLNNNFDEERVIEYRANQTIGQLSKEIFFIKERIYTEKKSLNVLPRFVT